MKYNSDLCKNGIAKIRVMYYNKNRDKTIEQPEVETMNATKYEIFLKILELGGMTPVAEFYGCSQANVSHIISGMEQELGFRLISRSRGGVKLTAEGEALLPYIKEIAKASERFAYMADGIASLQKGIIRIGAFSSVSVHWLPGIIKSYQEEYPDVTFKLNAGDYGDVNNWLTEGSVDVAFITLPCDVPCRAIPLKEDRLMAVLPSNHRYAGVKKLNLTDVANEDFITLLETSDRDSRTVLEAAGITPHIRFTTKDDYAIIAMVRAGLGISIMPELLLTGHTEQVEVRHLSPAASRTIALGYSGARQHIPAVESFSKCIQRWVQENS